MLSDWDWHRIDVVTGEWWLLLIGLFILAVGILIGYLSGSRYQRHYEEPPPPPVV